MATLHNFPIVSPGDVSICERNGQICTLPIQEIDISGFTLAELHDYPEINIGRELFNSTSTLHGMQRSMMVCVNERPAKRLARIFVEEGLCRAIGEAAQPSDGQPMSPLLQKIAQSIINFGNLVNRAKYLVVPSEQEFSVAQFSETRNWSKSSIRCIKWHPNCFKLAVAASDDSIRVYTKDIGIVPILKNGLQKGILCLAWRPFTAGELAVGCQNGVLIWSLDPNSNMTRPLSQPQHLRFKNNFPVSSIEWNPKGNLLATASLKCSDILIWNVDLDTSQPLKRVGLASSILKWSPAGQRLLSTTIGNVFRVWPTDTWTPERWSLASGTIQSAVWSSCGSFLLFVTTNDQYLYSLCFVKDDLFVSNYVPKEALPIADLSRTTQLLNQSMSAIDVGGRPQSLAWCPRNQHLAVSFKDSNSIAIFGTNILNHTLGIIPTFFLTGIGSEYPSCITFQNIYRGQSKSDSILTIGWSSGRVQYFPFV